MEQAETKEIFNHNQQGRVPYKKFPPTFAKGKEKSIEMYQNFLYHNIVNVY